MYANGVGVQQDYAEAAKWYRKAAEQGFAWAQTALGFKYQEGTGVPQDYAEAAKWYRKAAEQGFAWAQFDLGSEYELGVGVPRNYVLAHMWFNLAAAHGRTDFADYMVDTTKSAALMRDDLAKEMTPEQITEAQRLAREWKPTK